MTSALTLAYLASTAALIGWFGRKVRRDAAAARAAEKAREAAWLDGAR